ncbi:MAG: cation:proton antiporter [Bacteroidota bacterium]
MMENYLEILFFLAGFIIIAVASNQIAKLFLKVRLPLITGFLIMGILAGPFVLDLIPLEAMGNLNFVNDFSLAFIAFAAAAELYLRELRSRYKSIIWMTFGQLVVTFTLGSLAVFYLADYIPFMLTMSMGSKISVSILAGTIFVARSPASAIAIVNELRAKGPFTQTVMGVTVLKDFLVIMLFAVSFTISKALVHGVSFNLYFIILLLFELLLAFGIGYILGKVLSIILSIPTAILVKTAMILLAGYGVYVLSHFVREWSKQQLPFEIYIEPLLICIIGSFIVTNYSKYRAEFLKILKDAGPAVYVVFFTLTGASISLNILAKVWVIALILFTVRLLALVIAGFVGGYLGGDPMRYNRISWMPYVTQAGVSIGLATIVMGAFTEWGTEFFTVIIGVIVLNQFVGPPLFKWAIYLVGEGHPRAETPKLEGKPYAIIFGLEGQSFALARQLQEHGWKVKIASRKVIMDKVLDVGVDIQAISGLSLKTMKELNAGNAEAIVTMLSDKENYQVCEMAYEHFGTKDLVVRLNDRTNFDRFHELGCLIVEPSTAIVSLLDHLVRSPVATSLLLGMEENQDTVDLEVLNPNLHGIALRDLRAPADVIILSVMRGRHMMVTHGYSRLRLHDIVTVVGSIKSIENLTLRLKD